MNLWRHLANYEALPYFAAGAFTAYVVWKQPDWLPWIYSKLANDFPSPLYSIMGFVLTAVAIIVATNDSGRLTEISDDKPNLWRQLVRLFIYTASVSGIFATVLIFLDEETVMAFSAVARLIIQALSLLTFSVLVLLTGTSIYALMKFATAPRRDRSPTPERRHYEPPPFLKADQKEK